MNGIIPARAGFTQDGCWVSRSAWDHPRSRGVYCGTLLAIGALMGSSPLARGLLRHSAGYRSADGIIPARAGFTSSSPSRVRSRKDHPRSRGVYIRPVSRPRARGGSSPLARGLPHRVGEDAGLAGIIPARAGFTVEERVGVGHVGDHPRSRGVYVTRQVRAVVVVGSSPLARGLRHADLGVDLGRRIIPARAGFTSRSARPSPDPSDHPRSRGVYVRTCPLIQKGNGSSPLARGLRGEALLSVGRSGIIPARAGFTGSLHLLLHDQ